MAKARLKASEEMPGVIISVAAIVVVISGPLNLLLTSNRLKLCRLTAAMHHIHKFDVGRAMRQKNAHLAARSVNSGFETNRQKTVTQPKAA